MNMADPVARGEDALSKLEAKELIEEQGGKIFGCTFRKKSGEKRDMVCRQNVSSYITGGQNPNKPESDKIIVFDVEKMNQLVREFREKHDKEPNTADKFSMGRRAYRTINIDTLERVAVDGQEYEVK